MVAQYSKNIELKFRGSCISMRVSAGERKLAQAAADYVRRILEKLDETGSRMNQMDAIFMACMNVAEAYFKNKKVLRAKKNLEQMIYRNIEDEENICQLMEEKQEQLKNEILALQDERETLKVHRAEKDQAISNVEARLKEERENRKSTCKSILELQQKLLNNQIKMRKHS